jgi:hypothetical protein
MSNILRQMCYWVLDIKISNHASEDIDFYVFFLLITPSDYHAINLSNATAWLLLAV